MKTAASTTRTRAVRARRRDGAGRGRGCGSRGGRRHGANLQARGAAPPRRGSGAHVVVPAWHALPMPIYDYRCRDCDERFEELARNPDVAVACPSCGAAEAERLLSVFAGVGGSSRASAAPDMSRMPNFGTGGCGPGCGCHH